MMQEHPCRICGNIWHNSKRTRIDLGSYSMTYIECPRGFISPVEFTRNRRRVRSLVRETGAE